MLLGAIDRLLGRRLLYLTSKGPCSRQRWGSMSAAQTVPRSPLKRPKLAEHDLQTGLAATSLPASPTASRRSASPLPSSSRQMVAAAAAGAAEAVSVQVEAEAEAGPQGDAAPVAEAGDAEPQGQQQLQPSQPPQQPKKAVVMPTPIPPPKIPPGGEAWENGVLLVDKPKTWTSFDVCAKLRGALKQFKVKKVGHAGTLDPMATGLLIVCVGRGTKAVDSFMAMTKEYTGVLRLGEGTPSYDADSEVCERLPWEHITDQQLLAARDGLLGAIQQVPPMYSALRVGGKRLYEVARGGGEVERQPRPVTVHAFDVERDPSDPQNVRFRVVCSKGTYVRSLAHDLGAALGTAAHLTALRREAIGEYRVDNAWQVEDLAGQLFAQKKGRGGGGQPRREERDTGAAAEGAAAGAAGAAAAGAAEAAVVAEAEAEQQAN